MLTKKTVLFHYLLEQFGFSSFDDLRNKFRDYELGYDVPGNSIFYQMLSREALKFSLLKLKDYEDNIIKHLAVINRSRERKISLKYFQYFSLIFTEYYLDNYFDDKYDFCERLNQYLYSFNNTRRLDLPHYQTEELNKLSYWNATGSGKTFILHFNILQYKHYSNYYGTNANNYILLTPSEMMSKQHLEDLATDSIEADYYLNNKMGDQVKVIDIHKIRESKKGEGVTIGVDEFEQSNALFVDEGHKGSSGEDESVWRFLREKIGFNGFTFEYSATFGQISGSLQDEYAKNIIFDYSYGKFHRDGYGKDYWIHNISDNRYIENNEGKQNYLLLNLLLFVQQVLFYKNNKNEIEEYNIENPLLIFIGHTVNPKATSKSEKEDNTVTVSDVKILLEFIKDFLDNGSKYKRYIQNIFSNEGIYKEDYYTKLIYIKERLNDSERVYRFIIKEVFNAVEPDQLILWVISKADGEIALRLKGSENYFGLINIGDVSTFKTSLENEFTFEQDKLTEPLFDTISANKEKPINLLIGARKFIEGWNSYRVSSIGLINFGRAEGAQIIQLFGRGVRLRGKNHSLKRSERNEYQNIDIVETLNIFGLNADYMKKFRDDLSQEGVKVRKSEKIFRIVPKENLSNLGLTSLKKKDNITPFNQTEEVKIEVNKNIKVIIDLSTKRLLVTAEGQSNDSADRLKTTAIEDKIKKYIKWDDIYLSLLKFKREKRFNNLRIEKTELPGLLNEIDFELYTDDVLAVKSYEDIKKVNKVVLLIFEQYITLFFNRKLNVYEGQHLETVPLSSNHPNLAGIDYVVELIETDDEGNPLHNIEQILNDIEQIINSTEPAYPINLKNNTVINNTWLEEHLYQPLLDDEDNQTLTINRKKLITSIRPKGLNKGERTFIQDLRTYIEENKDFFEDKELYLLRNQSRKGFGFYFESSGGFYPDFILWIKQADKQYLTFIDPHGLRNEADGFQSDKIQLSNKIKDLELNDDNLILNSFILSVTPLHQIAHFRNSEEAEQFNVLQIGSTDYIEKIINKIVS